MFFKNQFLSCLLKKNNRNEETGTHFIVKAKTRTHTMTSGRHLFASKVSLVIHITSFLSKSHVIDLTLCNSSVKVWVQTLPPFSQAHGVTLKTPTLNYCFNVL